MDLTQKDLDEIAAELKKCAIPTQRCHYCKQPVYRLPFSEAPKIDDKIMCLDCAAYYMEYKRLNGVG